jgi:hypothetical protein
MLQIYSSSNRTRAAGFNDFHKLSPHLAAKSANVWLVRPFDVAQIVNLPYRGLAIRRRPKRETAADYQSAKQQTASLRYLSNGSTAPLRLGG